MTIEISNKTRQFEIIAAILTGAGKLFFVDYLNMKLVFIIGAILFWTVYVIKRSQSKNGILAYWGFSWKTAKPLFLKLLPAAILIFASFFAIGYMRGTLILKWHILPILLVYPIWGVIQQFLVVGLVAGNLQDMKGRNFPALLIIALTAALFAFVHYPSFLLIGGTFLLAIVYTIIYLKERQLWVLGLYHGWLGCFFYFFVLERNPWEEVFGIIF